MMISYIRTKHRGPVHGIPAMQLPKKATCAEGVGGRYARRWGGVSKPGVRIGLCVELGGFRPPAAGICDHIPKSEFLETQTAR